jgi:hypothetical protein
MEITIMGVPFPENTLVNKCIAVFEWSGVVQELEVPIMEAEELSQLISRYVIPLAMRDSGLNVPLMALAVIELNSNRLLPGTLWIFLTQA